MLLHVYGPIALLVGISLLIESSLAKVRKSLLTGMSQRSVYEVGREPQTAFRDFLGHVPSSSEIIWISTQKRQLADVSSMVNSKNVV